MEDYYFMAGVNDLVNHVPADEPCCSNRDHPHWQSSPRGKYSAITILQKRRNRNQRRG